MSPLPIITIASNKAAGKTYWRAPIYKQLVFIGTNNDGSGIDEHMKTYNLIPGREYLIRFDVMNVIFICGSIDESYGNPLNQILDMSHVNLYFKPLHEFRNDKLETILGI